MTASTSREYAAYLDAYPLDPDWRAAKEESGMNNTTRMIYAGQDKLVLRIYENHRDRALIETEHAILWELQQAKLAFEVPVPVRNRQHESITIGPDGKLAALYRYIPGNRPDPSADEHVYGLGAAAGELSQALARMADLPELIPQYKPYYELEENHGALPNEALLQLCVERPAQFGDRHDNIVYLLRERERLTALRDRFAGLPQQWIHGDIVFTNAVAREDRIAGLLDFEFCTIDARAMELAVVLAEFPGEAREEALRRFELFCNGFGERAKLSGEELQQLPALIKLRMIDVWLHFAGRLQSGLDPDHVLQDQIDRVSFVCKWVDEHEAELAAIFRRYITE
ncbi:phosphotransferase [Paenibacillus silvisoli]|uniref:phosphotransferase n=1 Tax=Paenibacillus silvisoli TaxID=3110539 RepID=UPI0028054BC3|nr:phosphotransferase [Paenibacillus silvisoli]